MPAERRTGGAFETQVYKKTGVSESFDEYDLSFNEVIFGPDERTVPHIHTARQILFITGGAGIVATTDEEHVVSAGDIVSIPPDERH